MATSETEVTTESQSVTPTVQARAARKRESVIDAILRVLSSVRFGIIMLAVLLVCCMIGMLIMQVELEEFTQYYEKLPPAARDLYTWLGFFDIYHSWYFQLLLAITALNIILASIDRFPTAWQYLIKPKLSASPNFIRAQMFMREDEVRQAPAAYAEQVKRAWGKLGFGARITEENKRLTVFAQKNGWNRLGAYVVHVALLTIFIGGFLTSEYGIGGMMEIVPGETSNTFITIEATTQGPKNGQAQLPFSIECTDLQQRLIRPEGGLEATNTIDWLSYVRIKDGDYQVDALVHLNNPYDYKGYRLFQSKFTAFGFARSIVVRFEPVNGGEAKEVTIPRDGVVEVEGIGQVAYRNFYPDFQITQSGPTSQSGDYNNPAAQLEIVSADGQKRGAFAFSPQLAERFLSDVTGKGEGEENLLLVAGNKVLLKEFEKAALGHTLAVQYDPGRIPAYIGFLLLCIALCGVFFFSHQRVWAVIEATDTGSKVYFGGNTNRNRPAFEGRFNSLVEAANGGITDEQRN